MPMRTMLAVAVLGLANIGCRDGAADSANRSAGDWRPAMAVEDTNSQATSDDMNQFQTKRQPWGKMADGNEVSLFTLTAPSGMQVKLIDYGAHLISVETPDRDGKLANITLDLNNLDAYLKHKAHLGATIGRFANRIAKGKFTLGGKEYSLPINNGPNHLHGGPQGFDHQLWQAEEVQKPSAVGVRFSYVSVDGEEGYPGKLTATATYWLTKDNELKIDYTATTDKETVVNLTNHAYWNLAGAGTGDVLDQEMMIEADRFVEVDETAIPTGKLPEVAGGPMDFTSPHAIGSRIDELKKVGGRGYDHCYVLRNQSGELALAARAKDPKSGRVMEVWTDQPGIQLYTGNFLNGDAINGGYEQHAAFCLETQHYPDSPNQPQFPSTVLRPNETFRSTTVHRFFVE